MALIPMGLLYFGNNKEVTLTIYPRVSLIITTRHFYFLHLSMLSERSCFYTLHMLSKFSAHFFGV